MSASNNTQKMKAFQKIAVLPYEELLQANIGLSTHRGGALFPNWEYEREARHCRRNIEPVDHPPAEKACTQVWNMTCTWGGPICGHFGHQIAEFSMRIPEGLAENPDLPVAFGVKYNSPMTDISKLPDHFYSIISWLGVQKEKIRLVTQPTSIAELLIYPQAETLHGTQPSRRHLDRLNSITARNIGDIKRTNTAVYVSRSRFNSGKLAGEKYLENFISTHGVDVIYPETLTLKEQLTRYATARHTIFSEGSALHALQLLGDVLGQVTVLMRRPGATMFRGFATARSKSYNEITLTAGLISTLNIFGTPLDASGISPLDENMVTTWLRSIDIPLNGWSTNDFRADIERDVRAWLSKESDRRPQHPANKGRIIQSLRDAGLPELATEVTRSFPESREIPKDALLAYRYALAHESKGDINSAIYSISEAISKSKDTTDFHLTKSRWLEQTGRTQEAWDTANTALSLSPHPTAQDLLNGAILASKAGHHDVGIRIIEDAKQLAPKNAGIHSQRSILLDRLGRISEAVEAAREASHLQSDNPHTHAHCANLLAKYGSIDEALLYIDRALEIAPLHANFHSQKSIWLGKKGHKAEALKSARDAVNLNPENASYRSNLANALAAVGNLEEALGEIDNAISLEDNKSAHHRFKAQLHERMGALNQALDALEHACKLTPSDENLIVHTAALASRHGRGSLALELMEKAINLAPQNGRTHMQRSVCLDRMGQSDEAKKAALLAIELLPGDPHALAHLSNVVGRTGDLDAAINAIDEAIKTTPDTSSFHRQRSLWLKRKGDTKNAIQALHRAVELSPNDPALRSDLSQILESEGDLKSALNEIDIACKLTNNADIFKNRKASLAKRVNTN